MTDSVVLVFDTTDPAFIPELRGLRWEDIWPRRFECGGSEGFCGGELIALITKPFTPGEDAVFAWASMQDECELVGITNLSDGRDFILLERRHVKQSRAAALLEHRAHLAQRLEDLGIRSISLQGR